MTRKERELRNIARRVRRRMDKLVKTRQLLFNEDLSGACGLASYVIAKIAKINRIVGGLCCGDGHWWLEWKGKIIDVTATQFGLPHKVIFSSKKIKDNYTKHDLQELHEVVQNYDQEDVDLILEAFK